MKIAVDAGALAGRGSGIARYLRGILRRAMATPAHEWWLYGRGRIEGLPAAGIRSDGLPTDAGRMLSLGTTQPLWAGRDRPDLFWGPAHRLPLWLPAATARVVTIHDLCWLDAPDTMRRSTRWLDRSLMPNAVSRADRVIAVSQATRHALSRAFAGIEGRVSVVHEAAEPLPPPGPSLVEAPYVLAVGTLEPRKNLARLIEAFSRIPTPARLVLAGGEGWGTPAPARLAARFGLSGRLAWLGPVDDATLSTLYAHARCLALPSLYEGFGLPILEALSLGTPVLYGDNSSMPEVAGEAGIGVDAGSVDSIAQGLARLLNDDALHATLASRARAQAAKFSWDRAARETLAVFEEAVAARQARRA